MLKTRILPGKIFSFALMLLLMFMVSGFLLHYHAAIAAESGATAGSGNGAQMGYWLGDGGAATSAGLNFPCGVAVDTAGNIYIADRDNNRIRKVDTTGIITTVAGNGIEGNSGDGGPATSAELAEPCGVAVDTAGNIYIADSENCAVRKVDSKGIISTIAGKGVTAGIATAGFSGYSGDNGPAINSELNSPEAVAVDRSGNIYIADTYNLRIREVAAVTAIQCGISMTAGNIYTVAGNGTLGPADMGGYSGDGGPATGAELAQPYGVAVDTSGNIYIADQNNFRIRKVDNKGIITTVAGGGATIPGYTREQATSAGIVPYGLAVDSAGDLFIADDYCIRKLDTATDTITTVAGNVNHPGYAGDGGPATGAELTAIDVAVDTSNNLYIVDNNRIRKVDNKGIITTVAGDGTANASGQLMAIFTVGRPSYALGRQTYSMDADPFISNGRLLVPVRFLADALGARASWDPEAQEVTVSRILTGFTTLEITIGSTAMVSTSGCGNTAGTCKTIQMDAAPVMVDSRIYLPSRYVAEALGYAVHWNPADQSVSITQ